jgi:predicted nuclease with RNAse H fold
LTTKITVGIDLAGKTENPTGWALLRRKILRTGIIYSDNGILEIVENNKLSIIAVDAPFNLPRKGVLRRADKEMISRGLRVFPPRLPAMKALTQRAIRLNKLIAERGYNTIEAHPTSTRRTLNFTKRVGENSSNPSMYRLER